MLERVHTYYGAVEESGSDIIDLLTAPGDQLLTMLELTQDATCEPTRQHSLGSRHMQKTAGNTSGRRESDTRCMGLSELSVRDPGMKEPEVWWSQVQEVPPHFFFLPSLAYA